jgi:hypothetical protein
MAIHKQPAIQVAAEVLLFVMAAGSTWSIDSFMGIF